MMKFRLSTLILPTAFVTLTTIARSRAGHSITVTVRDAPSVKLRLAYHVGNQQYLRDSLVTDSGGRGKFTGSERLPAGVYMIVLPDNHFLNS